MSFLNLIREASKASDIVFLQAHTRKRAKMTKLTITKNMKMKVDILAKKLVVFIDDDSSLEVIGYDLHPINSSKSKSFTKVPTITFGFTMEKLIRPRN